MQLLRVGICVNIEAIMELNYINNYTFKLKTKSLVLMINPESAKERADVVVFSAIGTERPEVGPVNRDKTFVVDMDGEYEFGGVAVALEKWTVGDKKMSVILLNHEGVSLAYLGEMTEKLTDKQIEKLSEVDVVLCRKELLGQVVAEAQPFYAVLMGYGNPEEVKPFFETNKFEIVKNDIDKLKLEADNLPENTEVIVYNV